VQFKPVLHATAVDFAATVRGMVLPFGVGAVAYAIAGTDTVQSAYPDPATGAYTLRFLAPGTYLVAASAIGFQAALTGAITLGNSETRTGVNLTLLLAP